MSNENKWTPGPWYVQRGFLTVYALSHGDHGATKAIASDCEQCDSNEEVAANAHLIAAAPELYEALNELSDLMQGVIDGDYEPDSFTLQVSKAALAKARGES